MQSMPTCALTGMASARCAHVGPANRVRLKRDVATAAAACDAPDPADVFTQTTPHGEWLVLRQVQVLAPRVARHGPMTRKMTEGVHKILARCVFCRS